MGCGESIKTLLFYSFYLKNSLKNDYVIHQSKEDSVVELYNNIAEYLRDYHREEDEAIKSRELRGLFNLSDRQVRLVVNDLRRNGVPICSSLEGYWYSEDEADITKTINRMEAQIDNMERSIAGLRKVLQEAQDE